MGLPNVMTLFAPVECYPAWYLRYLPFEKGTPKINSGCATSGGNVQCKPEDMAHAAGRAIGREVSLEAYTLARYLASEVGSGTLGERVAVAQNALNRVRYIEPNTKTITNLLLYRQASNHPNRGYYGPIHGPEGVSTAPYGRWAATSRDPSMGDLMIALGVLSGDIDPAFSKGADDQMGPNALQDPVGSVRSHGTNRRQYWVGPLPGINPWHTIQYRTLKDIAPTSDIGQALIARGVQAMQSSAPSWEGLPFCASTMSPAQGIALSFTTVLALGAGYVATRLVQRQHGMYI